MTNILHAGDTLARVFTFKDRDDALFDPTTISIYILDPAGAQKQGETPLDINDLTKTATGTYELHWNLPSPADDGVWTIRVVATYATGNLQNTEEFNFTVV